jgi:hypothetical protein
LRAIPLVVACVLALPGALSLYAALWRHDQWSSATERTIALITGASLVVLAIAVGQAAFTSGSTRAWLVVAGAVAAGAGALLRRIVRARWLAKQKPDLDHRGSIGS